MRSNEEMADRGTSTCALLSCRPPPIKSLFWLGLVQSYLIPACLWRWNSFPISRHINFTRRELSRRKHTTFTRRRKFETKTNERSSDDIPWRPVSCCIISHTDVTVFIIHFWGWCEHILATLSYSVKTEVRAVCIYKKGDGAHCWYTNNCFVICDLYVC